MRHNTKNHNAKITAVMVALIATTMVFAVQAKNRNGGQRGQRGPHMEFLQDLDLSEAQLKKVEAWKKKEQNKIEKIQKDMGALRDQMRAQWEKEPIDKKEIKALQKKMHDLRGKIGEARMEFRLGVYDVLTKEQRKKAAAERKRMHQERAEFKKANPDCPRGKRGRGDGHGRGHGRGPGFGPGFDSNPDDGTMW